MVAEPGRLPSDELERVGSAAAAGQKEEELVVRPRGGVEPDVVVGEGMVDGRVGRLRCDDVFDEGRGGFRRARHHRPRAKPIRPTIRTRDVLTADECEGHRGTSERTTGDA